MKKLKKPAWIAVLCICLAVILAASVFLCRYFFNCGIDVGSEDFSPSSVPLATVSGSATPDSSAPAQTPEQEPPTEAWGYTPAALGNVDVSFDELMEINPDIYAWIYIPNTNVDYPVAQSTGDRNDSFYLEHNIYRQYQFSGTIYSEVKNSTDFHDRVTVLYGHNMLNGSMFASLHNFEDKDFFDENNTIFVLTKDKQLTYLVYSAYTYDDRHILNSFFFDDDEVFEEYLDGTLNPHTYSGIVRPGVKLTTENRILTLSTCTSGASNTRFLVQGVLIDERDR